MNYQVKLDEIIEKISKEEKVPKLLLHACCAPCSSYCIEYLSNYFDITIYYYNPNVEPETEFEKRANEMKKFVSTFKAKNPVKCVIEHYDSKEFEDAVKGYEDEPEGSYRCFICYRLRMEAAAKYAKDHDFDYFTTTLSISPYKNSNKLNEIGQDLEKEIGIKYLFGDFKKKNGYKRSVELSKEYKLYRQDYCGCKYSKIAHDKREIAKAEKIEAAKEEAISKAASEEKIPEELEVRDNLANLYNNSYNKTIVKNKKNDKDPEMFKFHDIKRRDLNKPSFIKVAWNLIKILFLVTILATGVYLIFRTLPKHNEVLVPTEETDAIINELYIYGNHMNLKGNLTCDKGQISDVNLVMVGSDNTINYDLKYDIDADNNVNFYISDTLNTGFMMDNMIIDNYVLFIKVVADEKTLYYSLDNTSGYDDTTYYGISDDNISKKFVITNESKYHSMAINISKSTDEVYDVIIDPGHGGTDVGACYNKKCETDYTLMLSKLLKEDLEDAGFKVALTRDENEWIDKYGKDGRVTEAYESNAKMLISIHLNSSDVTQNGFELYTSNNVDYTFARDLVSGLDKVSDFTYSYNTFKKVENGIYTRTFASTDLNNLQTESKEKDYEPFDVSLSTNYYFMIRETGGYMTGAYVDGRDGDDENPYVDSNRGIESYILELGYITSQTDLDYIDKYKKDFMQSVSNTITSYYNK